MAVAIVAAMAFPPHARPMPNTPHLIFDGFKPVWQTRCDYPDSYWAIHVPMLVTELAAILAVGCLLALAFREKPPNVDMRARQAPVANHAARQSTPGLTDADGDADSWSA